jgi:hypothetical protein
MRNPYKDQVVKVSVLIKRAMLVVTTEDSKDLKRFCRDVFHKVKLGMSLGEINGVIMERDSRAHVLGMRGVEPALRHAAELSLIRQKTLADLKREEEMLTLPSQVEAKIKEALDIAGIAVDSVHGQGMRNHIIQAILDQPKQPNNRPGHGQHRSCD